MRSVGLILAMALIPTAAQTADGVLDPAFGNGGIVEIIWPAGAATAAAVGVDTNRRLLVGGNAIGPNRDADFALFRLRADGSLDPTYAADANGFRLVDFNLAGISGRSDDQINDLAVEAAGATVALGEAHFGFAGFNSQFALVQLDATGQLDSSFGSGGTAHFGFDTFTGRDQGLTLKLDTSGRAVASGLVFEQVSGNPTLEYWFGLARLTAHGGLDTSFYGSGLYQSVLWGDPSIPPPRTSQNNFPLGLMLDTKARIVIAGTFSDPFPQDAGIYRAEPDGQFDASFGPLANGRVRLNLANGQAGATYALADGRLMVAGSFGANGPNTPFLVRLNADGSLDTSFAGGLATAGVLSVNTFATMTLLQPSRHGGWLLAGALTDSNTDGIGVTVARFTGDGAPDPLFGENGLIALDPVVGRHFNAGRMVLQPDGKLVVAGSLPNAGPDTTPHFAVMRILADYETIFADGFDGG